MILNNKRNTGKEKMKERKRFPYKNLSEFAFPNKPGKYRIVDDDDSLIEECRLLATAKKRLIELKRDLKRDNLSIEHV